MSKKFRVLAIDGGGIRGIIPASVLTEIESQTGKPICESFDLICGTSTGGLLALGLTVPAPQKPNVPKNSAGFMLNFYKVKGAAIFHRSFWWKLITFWGWLGPKYPETGVVNALRENFGDAKLSECLTSTLIPSYDTNREKPLFFKSVSARKQPELKDFEMVEVGRSTSAAPTYFPSERIDKINAENSNVDGGVFVNDPAMCGYAEAIEITNDKDKDKDNPHFNKEIFVVSLGTGSRTTPKPYNKTKDWGKLQWMWDGRIIDVMSDGVSDAVDYQLALALNGEVRTGNDGTREDGLPATHDKPAKNYYRLQLTLAQGHEAMDDVSASNISYLGYAGAELVKNRKNDISAICSVITAP